MITLSDYDFSEFPADFDIGIYEDCRNWIEACSGGVVAVFDIGTRAVRLLVAPSRVPGKFEEDTFWSKGYVFNLGQAVSADIGHMDLQSPRLRAVLKFVLSHVQNLRSVGVNDINAIGSAVFRWLRNAEEVKSHFKSSTDLDLTILSQQEEARLLLTTLPEVLERRGIHTQIVPSDKVMLIDQGGGSLEVSWMEWSQRSASNPIIHQKLFEELGTEALKRCMYAMNAEFEPVEPEKNDAPVLNQIKLAKLLARLPIQAWYSSPVETPNSKIHAFAVGSAISAQVPGSSFERHGRFVELSDIEETIKTLSDEFADAEHTINRLYEYLEKRGDESLLPWSSPQELDKKLARICGLPIIQFLLNKIKVDGVTLSGYGLRYAYYIWRQLLTRIEPDLDDHSAFISYSKSDIDALVPELRLLRSAGISFWYDQGIAPGTDWVKTIAEKVEKSKFVICYLTPNSVSSKWVRRELTHADNIGKPIIFVRVDDNDVPKDLSLEFSRYQFLERFQLNDQAFKARLLNGLPGGAQESLQTPRPIDE